MNITLLHAATRNPVPWRNGGGTTREVACHPPGAGIDAFIWRASMAQVEQAGPFSHFPGIDRILTILSGTLSLQVQNAATINLTAASPPHAFPGDIPCLGTPLGGAVTDLNVMTKRGHETATVARTAGMLWYLPSQTCLVFALAHCSVQHEGVDYWLERHDALLLEDAGRSAVRVGAAALLISIDVRE